jgi:uncharacterized protein
MAGGSAYNGSCFLVEYIQSMHPHQSSRQASEPQIIAGPAGDLEALVDHPANAVPIAVAVVCHPHPLFGGTMTNKVAHTLAKTYSDLGATVVRFNFRGVGRSAGVHNDGHGEVDDALAAISWVRARWPGLPLWLAGFSFGAAVALAAALEDKHVARLVTVAPALKWLHATHGQLPTCPWLVVQGDHDELVNIDEVKTWLSGLAQPPQLRVLDGAGHFFHGRLTDLRDVVTHWMQNG